jgi:hydroxymethylpyrimidine pyrophosphatase-like HAD family hydrolase
MTPPLPRSIASAPRVVRLLMVTGRELPNLQSVCKVLDKFEWIVAENGALLYRQLDNSTLNSGVSDPSYSRFGFDFVRGLHLRAAHSISPDCESHK